MDLKLQGKRALVTGSTGGIGKAIAKLLAEEGVQVGVNGRVRETTERGAEELAAFGEVFAAPGDVSQPEGIAAIIERVEREGPLDILINNAAHGSVGPFFDVTDDDWTRSFESNVLSVVRLSRHFVPGMLERDWGRVVNISSACALQVNPSMLQYCTMKTAQLALTRGLAKLCRGTRVTINAVLPGPTWTPGNRAWITELAEERGESVATMKQTLLRDMVPTSLIERFADEDEIAPLVAFLCSPSSSAIIGAALRVDGGQIDVTF